MTIGSRWRYLDVEHWIWFLGLIQTTSLIVLSLVAVFYGLLAQMVVFALFPIALAVCSGLLTSAWHEGKAWSRWAMLVVSVFGLVSALSNWAADGATWPWVGETVLNAAILGLLAHPEGRALLNPAPAEDGTRQPFTRA
jgi:hypothetical protein